ncbi:MAG: hypothetical protein IPH75_13675 [bacterium]|nr:hypothetical protein [bacterium]
MLIAGGAMLFPALHTLTDVIEWAQGGFSTSQLWLNYVAFLPLPALIIGLYAVQHPRISLIGLIGALLYGFAFIYFSYSTLSALANNAATYEELWANLSWVYTFHGGLMIAGGLLFGYATMRAGVLPTWATGLFLLGLTINLTVALLPVPDLFQTIGSGIRNAGLVCMGWAVARVGQTGRRL